MGNKRWTMDDVLSKNLNIVGGASKLVSEPQSLAPKRKSKYNNKKVTVDGHVFDSRKEAERYQDLILLQKYHKITDLKMQVIYNLIVNDIIVAKYIADFVYVDSSGTTVVEDTKSEATRKNRVYRLKNKLMKAIYGITIKET